MLTLKLQYSGHLMQRADSLEKTLMLGNIEGSRKRGWQKRRYLDGIADSVYISLSKLWVMVQKREAWCAAAHGGLQKVRHNWTTIYCLQLFQSSWFYSVGLCVGFHATILLGFFFLFYWDIIDIQHFISLSIMIWFTYITKWLPH